MNLLKLGCSLITLILCITFWASAGHSQNGNHFGVARTVSIPANGQVEHNANTIPTWTNSFIYAGIVYPYTMVGTDPAVGPATTTIPVKIIPLRFVFSNGQVLDGSTKVALTAASPVFQAAAYTSGYTQYGDAMQRAQFWNTGGSDQGYHVLLGQPTILPTQTIQVPGNQGQFSVDQITGVQTGMLRGQWFHAKQQNMLASNQIDARELTIFLTYNTFLYYGDPSNCCILGWHGTSFYPNAPDTPSGGRPGTNGNGVRDVKTYIFASYSDPGLFDSEFTQDIHILSHEVSEWMGNPFINNVVPEWYVPTSFYPCMQLLENGDPVVGYGFNVDMNGTTYHPEDQVYLSWFAREWPSRAQKGYYSYLNTFSTYSSGCF